jgi:transposase
MSYRMEITEEQYARIKDGLPVQRGNVSLTNLRGLPKRFGRWHTIYMRKNRWAKNGVLDRAFARLQLEQIVRIKIESFSLDSTLR